MTVALRALALSMLLACACAKRDGDHAASGDGGTAASASGEASDVASLVEAGAAGDAGGALADDGYGDAPAQAGAEARTARLARMEQYPGLSKNTATVKGHFDGGVPALLEIQSTDLTRGKRKALLVGDAKKRGMAGQPLLMVIDAQGTLLWSKERPAAGVVPPVTALAIAGGPRGRVAMAMCDPPTSVVALRVWDEDGAPFGDFQVLETEACEQLSLLYWPRQGWVITASGVASTRAQFVSEDARRVWGRGIALAGHAQKVVPVSLVADDDDTFIAVQVSPARPVPHVLAYRYDTHGALLWTPPVDLGEIAVALEAEKVSLVHVARAVTRVFVPKGPILELSSSRDVTRLDK